MGLVKTALKNPYLVIVMALAILVLGVSSFIRLPADLLPIFKTPAVQIITFYPGMPAVVMERDIMSRLERWTGQSVGIEHQEGKSMIGVSAVKNFFREDHRSKYSHVSGNVTGHVRSFLFASRHHPSNGNAF